LGRIDLQGHLYNEQLIARERTELSGVVVVDPHRVIRHEVEMQESSLVIVDQLTEWLELNARRSGAGPHSK